MAASDSVSGAAYHITSANLQQHLQQQHNLEMQRLESHQLAANYASLAPPPPPPSTAQHGLYLYGSSANSSASTSYRSDATQRLSFSSTDSDSRGELATPEEAVQVWPFVSNDNQDLRVLPDKQHIQALESQSEDIMAQRERQQSDEKLQRPARLERFSSSATMTTTKAASQEDPLPNLRSLTIGTTASPTLVSPSLSPTSAEVASWHDVKRGTQAARKTMTSPDSWRSLLPEHDPYFASDTLKSGSSHRSASPAGLSTPHQVDSPSRTRRNTILTDYGSSTGRSSLSSANSSSSLTTSSNPSSNAPSSGDCPADSWRSLLPESDRYHHTQTNLSPDTRSLPLPSLHHALESSTVDLTNSRLAFSALGPDVSDRVARDVAAKRHASFSAVEADSTSQSTVRQTLSSLRDGIRAYPSTPSLQNEIPRSEERDSWPCNRQAPTDLKKLVVDPTTPEKKAPNPLASCSVSTPQSPCTLPFLDHRPAPVETNLTIETATERYTLVMSLPGFSLDCITLATKQHQHHRTLHIVADKWDAEGGGHFERRVTFPDKQCDLKNVKAEFDGTILRVYVPRM